MNIRSKLSAAVGLITLLCAAGPAMAQEAPAGADNTKVTDWTDPRPAEWSTKYPLMAPVALGDGSLQKAQENGITVCAQTNLKPIDFIDTATGKVIGFEPDILELAAERLGIKSVEFVNTDFGSLIPSLQADQCTIVMAGIAIRSDRASAPGIKYATPYFVYADVLVVSEGSEIKSEADLKDKVIAAVAGSTQAVAARQMADRIGGATVREFPVAASTYQALLTGNADALIDLPVVLSQNPDRSKMHMLPGLVKFTPMDNFANEYDKNPYTWGSAAPITKAADGDLNRALSVVFTDMIKDGTMQATLEKWEVYSEGVLDLIRE